MARPLRIEFPGACYHVINRGDFRFPLFAEERDRELILEKLVDLAEGFGVHVRGYCVTFFPHTSQWNASRIKSGVSPAAGTRAR